MNSPYTCLAYQINALTNLHVGSGEENYGLIDKLVQRDVLTGLPCIHPSSLKGALKQYLDHYGLDRAAQRWVFGSDAEINKGKPGSDYQTGEYVFLGAQLLALPLRSDEVPYVLATCPQLLQTFEQYRQDFGMGVETDLPADLKAWVGDGPLSKQAWRIGLSDKAQLENLDLTLTNAPEEKAPGMQQLHAWLNQGGEKTVPVVLLTDQQMRQCCQDVNLPVIARNALDEGVSVNLWYEQVLPRQTRMAAFILAPAGDDHLGTIEKLLQQAPVQIGANASVGFGFTRFTPLHTLTETTPAS